MGVCGCEGAAFVFTFFLFGFLFLSPLYKCRAQPTLTTLTSDSNPRFTCAQQVTTEFVTRYLARLKVAATKANIEAFRKQMPLSKGDVSASYKLRGALEDEVIVKIPEMEVIFARDNAAHALLVPCVLCRVQRCSEVSLKAAESSCCRFW